MGLKRVALVDPIAELEARVLPEHVLSVYLPATSVLSPRHHESVFTRLANRYAEQYLDKLSIAVLQRERPAIIGYLEQRQPPLGHGLALFTSTPVGLMSGWVLPVDEEADLRVGTRVHSTPLRRQLAMHPPSLVVAVDKERVRIFTAALFEVQEVAEFEGAQVKRHRQGGWSADSNQRKADQRARKNLGEAVRWLSSFDDGFFHTIHLAGTLEAKSELKSLLPATVKSRLGDDLPVALYRKPGQLIEDFRKRLES